MKLYIKQKAFSWTDQLRVSDADGNERYFVKGEAFLFGKKLHITDPAGQELMLVRQKIWSFRSKMILSRFGEDFATVIREITFGRPRYTVEGLGWQVTGNFTAHEYVIRSGERTVATVSKKWMTWGDSYELDVVDEGDERNVVGVLIAVDAIVAIAQSAAVAASN